MTGRNRKPAAKLDTQSNRQGKRYTGGKRQTGEHNGKVEQKHLAMKKLALYELLGKG